MGLSDTKNMNKIMVDKMQESREERQNDLWVLRLVQWMEE